MQAGRRVGCGGVESETEGGMEGRGGRVDRKRVPRDSLSPALRLEMFGSVLGMIADRCVGVRAEHRGRAAPERSPHPVAQVRGQPV